MRAAYAPQKDTTQIFCAWIARETEMDRYAHNRKSDREQDGTGTASAINVRARKSAIQCAAN